MGLKFCNETVVALKQIYPKLKDPANGEEDELTPLQEALIERLGSGAYPFSIKVAMLTPPSIQLLPAKEYNGAPIGTNYDIRFYVEDTLNQQLHRSTVKLDVRLINKISPYFAKPSVSHKSHKPTKFHLDNQIEKTFPEHTCSPIFLLDSSNVPINEKVHVYYSMSNM